MPLDPQGGSEELQDAQAWETVGEEESDGARVLRDSWFRVTPRSWGGGGTVAMNRSSGIITGDGRTVGLQRSEASVALAFADSPFNRGDDDDVDNDRRVSRGMGSGV